MELSVSNKIITLKTALGYSAMESIGSRVFDFATLWIVLNTLPTPDLAQFGLATSALFFFSIIFIAPETALFRYQKEWASEGRLSVNVSSFICFSFIKISIHYALAIGAYFYYAGFNWFVYAVIFSAITQQIQLAEIARIFMRMDLQQERVAKFELFSKLILCLACFMLFKHPSLYNYFIIYFVWSFIIALCWLWQLKGGFKLTFVGIVPSIYNVINSMLGFSLWAHISGILIYYINNSNILYLQLFSVGDDDIALYTVVSRVANLFFVIPMFFQSFIPVVLSNSGGSAESQFKKILLANGALSLAQFLFFLFFGWILAPFFGVKDVGDAKDFYILGLMVNVGILFLNFSRPLGAYLLMQGSPRKIMAFVYIPSAVLASGLYALGASRAGIYGCSIGMALAYGFMSLVVIILYFKHKKNGLIFK